MSEVLSEEKKILIEQLAHADLEVVVDSIKSIKVIGDEHFIEPLLACYKKNDLPEVRNQIHQLLADLHHSKAMDLYVKYVANEAPEAIDATLLSVIWQGKYTLDDHLVGVVKVAVDGNFEKLFELITILENSIESFTEEAQLESILVIKSYLKNNPDTALSELLKETEMHLNQLSIAE